MKEAYDTKVSTGVYSFHFTTTMDICSVLLLSFDYVGFDIIIGLDIYLN